MERQTDWQTNRLTDRQTYRETDRLINRQTERQTDQQVDSHTDGQKNRQTNQLTDGKTDWLSDLWADWQTDGQRNRQTNLLSDKLTDRETDQQIEQLGLKVLKCLRTLTDNRNTREVPIINFLPTLCLKCNSLTLCYRSRWSWLENHSCRCLQVSTIQELALCHFGWGIKSSPEIRGILNFEASRETKIGSKNQRVWQIRDKITVF